MNNITLTIFFYAAIAVVVLLSFCILYLVFVYRRLLEKYSDLSLKTSEEEINKKIKSDANKFVDERIDSAISKATEKAVDVITKNAKEVAKDVRDKTLEKLMVDGKGEEKAVAAEYDIANAEVENYKAREFEEIKKKSAEVLAKVTKNVLIESISMEKQEGLIIKALEDAKRSNLL